MKAPRKKYPIETELLNIEGLRREALGGLKKGQLALQALMNTIEQGLDPSMREYERIARHLRFAAGALNSMKNNIKDATPEPSEPNEEAVVQ